MSLHRETGLHREWVGTGGGLTCTGMSLHRETRLHRGWLCIGNAICTGNGPGSRCAPGEFFCTGERHGAGGGGPALHRL